jgi:hypothetical protein
MRRGSAGAVADGVRERLDEIARGLAKARTVQVGFLEEARYPNGTQVAAVAAFNEYGSAPKRPPRPFFRKMLQDYSGTWAEGIAQALKDNNYDAAAALDLAGATIKGQLQETINEYVGPPLAPATVAKKGFTKQLIDTATMINSVDYKVRR